VGEVGLAEVEVEEGEGQEVEPELAEKEGMLREFRF
jgi:hypothetical protein